MLCIDFFFSPKNPTLKSALLWSFLWISLGISFSGFILFFHSGSETAAIQYLTSFAIEKMLSIDNIFVFAIIFSQYKVPKEYHHKVLMWGVFGAILFRAIFIFLGVWLIEKTYFSLSILDSSLKINAILLIFGITLVRSGIFSLWKKKSNKDYTKKNWITKSISRCLPIKDHYVSDKIFIRENGILKGTLLLWVIIMIELSDIIFAIDSVPSIFSITKDFTLIYTSNIFAILGIRTLYFLLAALMGLFHYLKYALGFVLIFIGSKMIFEPIIHISPQNSLNIILSFLVGAIVLSYIKTYLQRKAAKPY